jgi:subtilase family serine protease
MAPRRIRALVTAAVAAALAAVAGAAGGAAPGLGGGHAAASPSATLASVRIRPGVIVMGRAGRTAPYSSAQCQAQLGIKCYTARQIEQAYDLPALYRHGVNGTGASIVIVEAYGSPTMRQDLATFDAAMDLPNPVLDIVQPEGKVPAYEEWNVDMIAWAWETTLDVEWAHSIAPHARIVLVEATSDDTQEPLLRAVQYAIDHRLGDVISQSWLSYVDSRANAAAIRYWHDAVYAASARQHVTVVVSAGDNGVTAPDGTVANSLAWYTHPVTGWQATDPDVTAVGGTNLNLDADGNRVSPDTVWNDTWNKAALAQQQQSPPYPAATGGGRSAVFPRPSYQDGVERVVGGSRGIPDISVSGSCAGSVDIYLSAAGFFNGSTAGWNEVCGTSESAPVFAGIVALAAQVAGHPLGLINPAIYRLAAEHAKGIVPVTAGSNTVAFTEVDKMITVPGYEARDGYSMATGVGTINAEYFVPELAG